MDCDQPEAIMDEAHTLGLRTATHIAVEETTADDYIDLGVNSIEHFYGVADAALTGIQAFPPEMNYSNEIHRFGRAGELYAQADPASCTRSSTGWWSCHVAWDPTFSIYEASRDLIARAEPAVVPRRPTRPSRSTSRARSKPRLGLLRLDRPRKNRTGVSSTRIWNGRACASSGARAASSRPETMPATSLRCTASASQGSSSCTRKPDSSRSK